MDEFVDMMTYHLVGGHFREYFELVSIKEVLRPR